VSIRDRNVPLNGIFNVMGRAIVIHNFSDASRIASGIIAVLAE